MQNLSKRGAIELSIGTIVIIVLAMSMLILGLILIKNIFSGANYNVDIINQKVTDQINKLFSEDSNARIVINLPNSLAQIKQGQTYGVGWGLRNLATGTTQGSQFVYRVFVSDSNIRQKCGIGDAEANAWIQSGASDTILIAPGQQNLDVVRFQIPQEAPLCIIRFHIEVTKDGAVYDTESFDVQVTA